MNAQAKQHAIENAKRQLSTARAAAKHMLAKYNRNECGPELQAVKWAEAELERAQQMQVS